MRRLTLHTSALNDDEYDLYTSSIADLALCDSNGTDETNPRDDRFYEEITVGVREVRAWLRGRYPDIAVNSLDAILKFFSPTLSHSDTLSGGQFFAVLRLVLHVQGGKDVDRTLAFVQAHPKSSTGSDSPRKLGLEVPPRLASRSEDSYVPSVVSEPVPPSTNPFAYDSGQQPPLHPSQRQDPPRTTHSPNNPFVIRSKSVSSKSEDGSSRLPPLPPRKPSAPVPPPRHGSVSSPVPTRLQPTSTNTLLTSASTAPQPQPHSHHPPPPPPKPKPVTHVTSTLMKRSLQASKAAQTMKKAEDELGKERVLQVLRSSAVVSGARSFAGASISGSSIAIGSNMRNQGSGSRSPSKRTPTSRSTVAMSDSSASWSGEEERERPPLPRRRPHQQQQQPSPPMSTSSLEQVALAVAPSGTRSQPHTPFSPSPFESPNHSPRTRTTLDLPGVTGLPPPTHPDRKPYGISHQFPSIHPDNRSRSPSSSSSPFHRNPESFEAVYGSNQSSRTTPSLSVDTPTTPTPTSGTLSSGSPQPRMFRSKSLHHHTPPAPPPPPPVHRRRPESIQVLPNGEVFMGGSGPKSAALLSSTSAATAHDSNNALKNSMTQVPSPHRRSSYSSSLGGTTYSSALSTNLGGGSGSGSGGGGTDTIHRKLVELQLKAENALPKLEAARYKAEAGLSRRGFIQGSSHGSEKIQSRQANGMRANEDREGLMSGYPEDQYNGESDGEEDDVAGYGGRDENGEGRGLSVDSGDEDCMRGRRREEKRVVMERDELKWPVGEGWKML